MLKKVEKTAKNLNEAVELAAKELGVTPSEVGYEILRDSSKGFMRFILGSEVEISAWIAADKEKEDAENAKKKAEVETKKAKLAESRSDFSKKDEKKKPEIKKNEKKSEEAPSVPNTAAENEKPARAEKREKREEKEIVIPKEAVDDAKMFLSTVLDKMGYEHTIGIRLERNEIRLEISGEKVGSLIGSHGRTLDSIQLLTSLYVNRDKKQHYIKVTVDAENYRKKREETLVNLARGIARNVIRTQQSVSLEPMSSVQRRIIHLTLQNNNKVKTFSVGEEPRRRVVVAPVPSVEVLSGNDNNE